MKPNSLLQSPHGATQSILLATLLLAGGATASASVITLDFEGVPSDFQYAGAGLNLGVYYAAQPNAPVFGPGANVLDGSSLYPAKSGTSVLASPDVANIEIQFTGGPVGSVSTYYRSNVTLSLFAYDAADNLLGSVNGPDNLAPAPDQYLVFNPGGIQISRIEILGAANAFVLDDFTYSTVPEPAALALVAGLGLGAFAFWRQSRRSSKH